VITLLLRFVSGVPLLERKARQHPEWAQYEAETNCFFPWFWDKNAVAKSTEHAVLLDDSYKKVEEETQNKI